MEPTVDAPLALKDATASGFLPPEEPLLGADDDDIDHASEAGAQPLLEVAEHSHKTRKREALRTALAMQQLRFHRNEDE